MSEVANLYDNGPISPVAKIKENLSIWTGGAWSHYQIEFIEPMPRSRPMTVEMVTATGNVVIAANGLIAKSIVAILQLADTEFFHLRWEPIDDVEGVLWELASLGRFASRAVHARVTRFTSVRDPFLATTTFWVMGQQRDMQLEVQNPNPVALPQARFVFFGYRYILSSLKAEPARTTYIPAEGRTK